ncbi:GDH/6PGL endoplasmic bifunctional protein [Platysternon megacephalum]|uniref:GDH/6PGL endoplasmic bifunctional protein n=1 Tax=Platysternon megacephalum TaxID=55544 RepID=A0A4D9ESX4_9SAUR|nr:GDH/6PGL endoplasmic bifunctional protein [Platysternon megacephalum]
MPRGGQSTCDTRPAPSPGNDPWGAPTAGKDQREWWAGQAGRQVPAHGQDPNSAPARPSLAAATKVGGKAPGLEGGWPCASSASPLLRLGAEEAWLQGKALQSQA